MSRQQKMIIAALAAITMIVLASLICAMAFALRRSPGPTPIAITPDEVALQPAPAPTPSATLEPPASATPPALPSPTSTRVVVETVLPSPTPTVANCENQISNFEASGIITTEEVKQYIRQTLPLSHLDYCRGIEYMARQAAVHATPIAGSIIPVYRIIYVYETNPEAVGAKEQLLDTLVHEIGHNVHYNIRRTNFDLDVRWAELYRQSQKDFASTGMGFVSDYARTSKFEDFAETYSAYVRYPDILLLVSPEKYDFMKQEVFDNQEFPR